MPSTKKTRSKRTTEELRNRGIGTDGRFPPAETESGKRTTEELRNRGIGTDGRFPPAETESDDGKGGDA